MALNLEDAARQIEHAGIFLGGPVEKFASAGRAQLIELLRHGLEPSSTVLDVGCGCLRGGHWVIRLLEPDCYCGIEPDRQMLASGLEHLLTPEIREGKRPRFSHNDDFDFTVFDQKFDFVIARSIWTHASPAQIDQMLRSFKQVCEPHSIFLTSVTLAHPWQSSYDGDEWVGRSHTSDKAGIVRYTKQWLKDRAQRHGCALGIGDKVLDQTWVEITPVR